MPRTAATAPIELPSTISGLWALCALTPFRSRAAYEEAADLCAKFAVRRLNAVQREYFRELTELVEGYEDEKGEAAEAIRQLKKLAAK